MFFIVYLVLMASLMLSNVAYSLANKLVLSSALPILIDVFLDSAFCVYSFLGFNALCGHQYTKHYSSTDLLARTIRNWFVVVFHRHESFI